MMIRKAMNPTPIQKSWRARRRIETVIHTPRPGHVDEFQHHLACVFLDADLPRDEGPQALEDHDADLDGDARQERGIKTEKIEDHVKFHGAHQPAG